MMKKKKRTLSAGAAAVAVLFGAYGLLKQQNSSVEEGAEETVFLLPDFDGSQIETMSFRIGENTVEFTRDSGEWRKTDDSTFPADGDALTALLTELAEAAVVRSLGEASDASEYGMTEPQNVITVTDGEGAATEITIGATNGSTGDDYVMLNGKEEEICTVSSGLRAAFSDDLYDYAVSETIPGVQVSDVDEITVEGAGEDYRIFRDDDTWCVEGEDGTVRRADKDEVNSGISTLISGLSYTGFLEHGCTDGSGYGLDETAVRLTVFYHEDPEPETGEETDDAETEERKAAEEGTETGKSTEIEKSTETEESTGTPGMESVEYRTLTFLVGDVWEEGGFCVQMEGSAEVHTMTEDTFSAFLETSPEEWEE